MRERAPDAYVWEWAISVRSRA